jgi:hypothetical protein
MTERRRWRLERLAYAIGFGLVLSLLPFWGDRDSVAGRVLTIAGIAVVAYCVLCIADVCMKRFRTRRDEEEKSSRSTSQPR